jgi:hypothetical protein
MDSSIENFAFCFFDVLECPSLVTNHCPSQKKKSDFSTFLAETTSHIFFSDFWEKQAKTASAKQVEY